MSKLIQTFVAAVALSAVLVTSVFAAGLDVNATSTGLALRGFDPVSYHSAGAPQAGSFQITAEHNGAVYRFVTEANRDLFKKDAAKYVPAYGGYCAFGTAMGFKFDGDPHVWKIVDGKLYLNLAPAVSKRWRKDIPGFIKKADVKWSQIKDKAPSELRP